MKKITIVMVLIVGLILSGCESPKADSKIKTDKNYTIKVIDGCEYIECDYGIFDQRVYSLTHKGNCKNPIHKCGQSATLPPTQTH